MSLEIYLQLRPKLKEYFNHPVEFAQDVFGLALDEWQEEFLQNINDNQKVACAGATGSGKSTGAALAIWWFIATKVEVVDGQLKFPKLMVTGPSENVLKDGVWAQLSELHRKSPLMQLLFNVTATKIYMKGAEREWFCVLKTTAARYSSNGNAQAESLQGFHALHTMVFVDEGCHDDQTEVLTDQGWMFFKDIPNCKVKPKILSMDRETRIADYYDYTDYIEKDYDGEMYSFKTKRGNFLVTPSHKFFYKTGCHVELLRYDSIKNVTSKKMFIPRTCKWIGKEKKEMVIRGHIKDRSNIKISMDSFLKLLGWYLSEGWCIKSNTSNPNIYASFHISQLKKQNHQDIIDSIVGCGFKYSISDDPFQGNLRYNFNVCNSQVATYLSKLGKKAYYKYIPKFIFKLSPRQIEIFLDSFFLGDGSRHGNNRRFITSSKKLADQLQHLCLLIGRYATVYKQGQNLKGSIYNIKGKTGIRNADCWVVTESAQTTKHEHLTIQKHQLTKIKYTGKIFCLSVPPHHLLYTRRHGRCMWSGNSGLGRPQLEAILGSAISDQRKIVMAFNPLRDDGYPYLIYNDKRYGESWCKMNVSFYDIPRLCNDPKMAAERESWIKMYGANSAYVQARVYGKFPTAATTNRVFTHKEVKEARERNDLIEDDDTQITQIGIDCSRFGGDESVYYVRRGNKSLEMIYESQTSGPHIEGRAVELAMKWCPEGKEPKKYVHFVIDETGIGGSGPVDHLIEQGWIVAGVNNGSSPTLKEDYRLMIDELWLEDGKDAIRDCGLIDDDILANQLLSRTYTFTGKAKQRRISTKDEMRSKKLESPDRADAFILAFANPDKLNLRSLDIKSTIDFF